MTILKAWFIEEIELPEGGIAHRQSEIYFDNTDGSWVRPDDRLTAPGRTVWNTIMSRASDIQGQDLRKMLHPISLQDYCNNHEIDRIKHH